MLPSILILATMGMLGYASLYDLKHKLIQFPVILLIYLFGIAYIFLNKSDLFNVGITVLVMVMLFGGAYVYGMGAGDMLLFIGLSLFFESMDDITTFMILFIVVAVIVVIFYYWKKKEIRERNKLLKFEFPLVPVIFASFCFFNLIKNFVF